MWSTVLGTAGRAWEQKGDNERAGELALQQDKSNTQNVQILVYAGPHLGR